MDNGSGNDKSDTQVGQPQGGELRETSESGQAPGFTRRTFSKTSVTGAGVLLTLSNSAAWGTMSMDGDKTKKGKKGKKGKEICVSTMMLESFHIASSFKRHKKDKKFRKFMSLVDMDGNPLPGYEITVEGRLTCIRKVGSGHY